MYYPFEEMSADELVFKEFSRSSEVVVFLFFSSFTSASLMVSTSNIPEYLECSFLYAF